jgi:catechol 2,3-dioxygenase-like lactoylglutathione lyase family enzyme
LQFTDARILTSDFGRSLEFYRDVLGLEATLVVPGGIYAEFKHGDATLSLYKRELMAEVLGHDPGRHEGDDLGAVVLTFAVDSVDSVHEALVGKGIDFLTEPHDQTAWQIRVAHFYDPDGNVIEIYHPIR